MGGINGSQFVWGIAREDRGAHDLEGHTLKYVVCRNQTDSFSHGVSQQCVVTFSCSLIASWLK